MDKYIKDEDLKKYLDKQYKEAVRLRDIDGKNDETVESYYQGEIDQIKELAKDFDIWPLWC